MTYCVNNSRAIQKTVQEGSGNLMTSFSQILSMSNHQVPRSTSIIIFYTPHKKHFCWNVPHYGMCPFSFSISEYIYIKSQIQFLNMWRDISQYANEPTAQKITFHADKPTALYKTVLYCMQKVYSNLKKGIEISKTP